MGDQLPRYEWQRCPFDGYDLSVAVCVNPSPATYAAYLLYNVVSHDRALFGAALVVLFGARQYGPLDFRSPESALASTEGDNIPAEIQAWLLDLPFDVVEVARGHRPRLSTAA
jgi:hypothetical protein